MKAQSCSGQGAETRFSGKTLPGQDWLFCKPMWPLPDKNASLRGPKPPEAKEFERRYREHLATLPPERISLFEMEEYPVGGNSELMRDLIETVGAFKDEFRDNPAIDDVRPGLATEFASISVVLKPGCEARTSGLPEFYRGCWVRIRPRPVDSHV